MQERIVILITIIVSIYFIFDTFLLNPFLEKQVAAEQQEKTIREQTKQTKAQLEKLQEDLKKHPYENMQAKHDTLAKQNMTSAQYFNKLGNDFIDAAHMAQALQDILVKESGVHLISAISMPVEKLLPDLPSTTNDAPSKTNDAGATVPPNRAAPNQSNTPVEAVETAPTPVIPIDQSSYIEIYKHGLELTLQGDYSHLREYLKRLENTGWHIYWDQLQYKVVAYPLAQMNLRLYTLNTQKQWLGI